MTGRISRGWRLFKATFGILKAEKSLVLFPVISAVLSLLVLVVFIFPALALFSSTGADTESWGITQWAMWVAFIFVFYFITYLITIFFKTAVISNATEVMNGNDPTMGQGIGISASHIGKLAIWALIQATIGLILSMIRSRDNLIATILSAFLAAAWELVTFFVIPVLIFENQGVPGSVKESWNLFKKTWGETVVSGFSFIVLYIPAFIMMFIAIGSLFTGIGALSMAAVGLFLIILVATGVLASTLHGILVALLYNYARTGEIPGMVDRDLIENAFVESKKEKKTAVSGGGNI
ncbi:MAG: hypothetical protein JW931_07570 [Methanomicrobiaceae archaeon]|nr:hypothetical protein [Methanomicrobiaceae archaeon]